MHQTLFYFRKYHNINWDNSLMTPQLPLWDWANPRDSDIETNGDGADNPEHAWIVKTIVTEDNSKDDATKVT
jgi:hypothetical protein